MKKKRHNNIRKDNLVPFETIKAATEGNLETIEIILEHFDPYITSLAKGLYIRPNGEYQYVIDQQVHDEISVKLIDAILKFRI